jgi:hypothetical protein
MRLIAHRRLPTALQAWLLVAAFALLPLLLSACSKKADPASPAGSGGEAGRPPSTETGQAIVGNGGATGAGGGAGAPPPATGVPCGPKTCAAGQVCCNASCGICTPPDGVCTQQLCSESDGGGSGGSSVAGPPCRLDSECRLFSDYCTGCDCRALLKADKDPLCSGPGVRCLADPCRNHTAVCRDGKCQAAVPKTPRGP